MPTFMLGSTLDAPCTTSTLNKDQRPESHLHLLYTVEVVLRIEEVLRIKSIATADELLKSL